MGLRISRRLAARLAESGATLDPAQPLHLADGGAARQLAAVLEEDSEPISAGQLLATVELARVLRRRLDSYFARHPVLLEGLWSRLEDRLGRRQLQAALEKLEESLVETPSEEISEAHAEPDSAPIEARPLPLLAESLLIFALAQNPATAGAHRALQGSSLIEDEAVARLLEGLAPELEMAPPLDEQSDSLRDSLEGGRATGEALPDQLRQILDDWPELEAGERSGLMGGIDLISEEERPRFPPGPGPVEIPDWEEIEDEAPHYSRDRDWMEPLVLQAKNTYVWLAQLSNRYERPVERLDQIPDEELERLERSGISGLWLIGIWERSRASAEIKRRMGNEEALASAYSVREYEVASELGGREAAEALAERATEHGVRLAADMVPNHMGVDSRWLIEHPERFLSVPECPFPSYTFDGPDLSPEPEVGIFLEDHYYDRSDAAVVFKRVDHATGEERFVYHGNDGTSTPWNDTAQLDYLNPETREAVLDTIVELAGSFPILRFDAAMTLARRHVRRLWFPEPGQGGAIPSRSDHALEQADFDRAMPTEFWRDVVARVAEERPDTLLLAEAFWLMEGYFVRSLGMHRVYNSAFMHLVRDGDMGKLRTLIEETVNFDRRILARFVNFLSNPDEETAIDQFGRQDRYFGACTVLATLPGLPLFAHGQHEGLAEKYGMEFRRPRLAESPDANVVRAHRRRIQPLLRRRHWFAGAEAFRLLDYEGTNPGGVLTFANGRDTERSVVVFNNSENPAQGVLDGLDGFLTEEVDTIQRFRDLGTGRTFFAETRELAGDGLPVHLDPYEARVLVDFRPVLRTEVSAYRELAQRLDGRGVRNPELELRLQEALPVLKVVAELARTPEGSAPLERELVGACVTQWPDVATDRLDRGLARCRSLARLEKMADGLPWPKTERLQDARRRTGTLLAEGGTTLTLLRATTLLESLREPLDDALWTRAARELSRRCGDEGASLALALAAEEGWVEATPPPGRGELGDLLAGWLARKDAPELLGLNRHEGESWVRQEELERLLRFRAVAALCGWLTEEEELDREERALAWIDVTELALGLFVDAGYAVGPVQGRLKGPTRHSGSSAAARAGASGSRSKRRRRRTSRPKR